MASTRSQSGLLDSVQEEFLVPWSQIQPGYVCRLLQTGVKLVITAKDRMGNVYGLTDKTKWPVRYHFADIVRWECKEAAERWKATWRAVKRGKHKCWVVQALEEAEDRARRGPRSRRRAS